MRKLIRKIIIPLVVLVSVFSSQVISPSQAYAGNSYLNYDNPNKDGNNPPFKLNFTNVTPQLLTSVVSCTGIENKLAVKLIALNDIVQKEVNKLVKKAQDAIVKALTSKAKRLAQEKAAEAIRRAAITAASAAGAAASTTAVGTGVPGAAVGIVGVATDTPHPSTTKSSDADTQKKLDQGQQDNIASDAKKAKDLRIEKCIDGIAVRLAKNQLTSMTKYTMNWINSGFNGDPLFVTNINSFMQSITDGVVQREVGWFKGPLLGQDHPFGRDVATDIVNSYKVQNTGGLTDASDMSNYVDGATSATDATNKFANDFSTGGWNGWLALTQHDQNNPLGYRINVSQKLADKIDQEKQNAQNEILQGGGYVAQKKCALWQTVDKDNNPEYNEDGTEATSSTGTPTDICLKYETVTPSSTIKAKVDTYVNTPERQLELVKTMDDALNALFGALISQFENQGLSSLRSSTNNFTTTTSGGFGINQIFDSNGNVIGSSAVAGGGSTATNAFFNITTDLGNVYDPSSVSGTWKIATPGVIQLQHDYADLLAQSKTVLDKVMPAIGKLDYCIPGPNPSWQALSQDAITTYIDNLSSDPGAAAPIDPSTLSDTLTNYQSAVDAKYGATSPMQTSGTSAYLPMATEGLGITKDIASYADTISTAQSDNTQAISDSATSLAALNVIKDKVDAIIIAAQARRQAKRSAAGLPSVGATCIASEKVTYLDGNQIKY